MKATIVLEILILIGLVGCGKSKEETIVGKWKEVGGTQTIEFFKDGTVTVVDEDGPALPGDYRFIDDNQIRMNLALFGPITVKISPSLDEITLTNPFGKIEKYRKLRQIEEITRSSIAGDYIIVRKMPGGEEFKNPGLITLKEDGTGLSNYSGKWEISGDQLEFCYNQNQDMTGLGGQITTDTLSREPLQVSLRKQRKAKVIERIETGGILWSKYYFTGDKSNIIKSVNLEIKEDGTFQELWVARDAWRIKDGVVEITITDENRKEKKLKGKIERDTIIFQDGETEFRYIRAENVYDIVGEKAQKEPGTKRDIARAKMAIIEAAIERFAIDCGRYPDESEGLEALLVPPADLEEEGKWRGPYLKASQLLDPWKNPVVYNAEGEINPGSYDLVSLGADGQEGGEGDNEDVYND